jgi:ribosomal-protein-alanine N-acetyltransferase
MRNAGLAMLKNTHIETERLLIRPMRTDDAVAVHALVSDPDVMKYLPGDMMTLEQVQKTIVWLEDCYQRNTPDEIIKLTLAVVDSADGGLIGWCGLGPLEVRPAEIELYYGLSKEHWGRGLATEAATAMLDYGFGTVGLDRIVAVTSPGNVASQRVIQKLGMVYEDRLTDLPEKHSSYEGDLYYALTREAWYARIPHRVS